MCACGCFLLLAVLAALLYCYVNGYWIAFGLVIAVAFAAGWFGRNMANWRPAPRK
jgi:hypothetical protein